MEKKTISGKKAVKKTAKKACFGIVFEKISYVCK
jgi:hypothetical protein